MALIQQVKDGKFVDETTGKSSTSTKSSEKDKKTNELGYDQFLQILCAEMQYQDPLEPTTNTEWVSQMATFSQIEELQNMSESMRTGQAQNLVGKYVIMATTDSTGETKYTSGKVQTVEIREDGTYLSIGGYLYNIDDLYSVVDEDYYKKLTGGSSTGSGSDSTDKE